MVVLTFGDNELIQRLLDGHQPCLSLSGHWVAARVRGRKFARVLPTERARERWCNHGQAPRGAGRSIGPLSVGHCQWCPVRIHLPRSVVAAGSPAVKGLLFPLAKLRSAPSRSLPFSPVTQHQVPEPLPEPLPYCV